MVFYFTGTGNRRYIARRIAAALGDEVLSINERIRAKDTAAIGVRDRLILVTPTYAWRIPRIVKQWLLDTAFPGAKRMLFVMDCGDGIGDAAHYNRALCREKGLAYMGTLRIVMPENYIAMFDAPQPEQARRIIARAEPLMDAAACTIAAGKPFLPPRRQVADSVLSGPINAAFYAMQVRADPFRVDDTCIGCGKCAALFPLNNIHLLAGRPVWGTNCTHCMACICHCPTAAIEYGTKSVGKPRYRCE